VRSTPKPGGTGKIFRMSCAAPRSRAIVEKYQSMDIFFAKKQSIIKIFLEIDMH